MAEPMENGRGPVQDPPRRRWSGRLFLDAIAESILTVCVFVLSFIGWTLRWSFATVFFLAVMAAAGWYIVNKAVAGGEQVRVPNIVDMPIDQAARELYRVGLEMGKGMEVRNDSVPENHVVAQRPPAGTVVRAGRRVVPTISVGPELAKVDNYVGKLQSDAQAAIVNGNRFIIGGISRMNHRLPKDTVIFQDPPPGTEYPTGEPIHLLVSMGGAAPANYMPDLVDRSLQEVMRILAPYRVKATPIRVERPDAPYNIVLEQSPPPGTEIHEGEEITYTVRTYEPLETNYRTREVTYTMPQSFLKREVRVDVVEKDKKRYTLYPQEKHYVDGAPPKLAAGTAILVPSLEFNGQVTIEIYLEGELVESYLYVGDSEPVKTTYGQFEQGGPGA